MAAQTQTGAERMDDSFDDIQVVTPSDTIGQATRLSEVRAIRSTAGGAVKVITMAALAKALSTTGAEPTASNGVVVTLVAGETLRLRVAYVLSTGTAAADIEALF